MKFVLLSKRSVYIKLDYLSFKNNRFASMNIYLERNQTLQTQEDVNIILVSMKKWLPSSKGRMCSQDSF